MTLSTDSSPFQSSPLDGTTSPRLFWQNRNSHKSSNSENDLYGGRSGSPSPVRRSSIERLQRASRVKNSTMFAREQKHEYDPTRLPTIERPLAKVQGNAYGGTGRPNFRPSHGRSESETSTSLYSPSRFLVSPTTAASGPRTPSKDQASPMKSSLSMARFKSSNDSQSLDFSADNSFDERELPQGKALHRNMKSVTFDNGPPQVNEYEMATPDLSSIGTNSREGSYESDEDDDDDEYGLYPGEDGEAQDDSFDATLEDTDKTPVVGPDDWRQQDPFESSPMPERAPSQPAAARPQHGRTDSSTSSGDHRPLPPLPPMGLTRTQSPSSNGLSATAERMHGVRRDLPSPPAAAASKSEIQNIGNGKMSLEERLKLMMLSDETSPKAADKSAKSFTDKAFAEQQRERRMRRAGARDRVGSPTSDHDMADSEAGEEDDALGDLSGLDMDYQFPSISRQSIMKRVNGNKDLEMESDFHFNSSPAPSSSERRTPYDPDVPIASIEDSILEDVAEKSEDESSVIIKGTDDEKDDVYDLYGRSEDDHSETEETERDDDDDSDSQYSDEVEKAQTQSPEDDSVTTPRAATSPAEMSITNFSATLPQVNTSGAKDTDFTRSFQSYMLPKPKESDAVIHTESHKSSEAQRYSQRPRTPDQPLSKPEYDGSGWGEPDEDEEEEEEPGTPESVIHHPVSDDDYEDEEENEEEYPEEHHGEHHEEEEEEEEHPGEHHETHEEEPRTEPQEEPKEEPLECPEVPERVATIKSASGSKLKTRPSATPSDLLSMREARRHVSHEVMMPEIPAIPDRHRNRLSRDFDTEQTDAPNGNFLDRHPSFKKRSLTLDLDLGLSLDQDFDRVIEAQKVAFQQLSFANEFLAASSSPTRQVSTSQVVVATDKMPGRTPGRKLSTEARLNANITARKQRGYLMRQNTKLVTASDKQTEDAREGTRSAGNSPVKQTARPQSWTVEPWNGRPRQRSIKKRSIPSMSGPVPPVPGQETNATALSTMPEETQPELATDECGERGRLFVKVMGVKDLDLPLPRTERTWFSLTLDNGVHCVTTAWLELARNAPIGQEFELVVPNDLEFQLTLNVKLERPEPQHEPLSPAKATKVAKPKISTFSRVFGSPKKRKEMEARMKAEEEAYALAQREAATRQRKVAPSAWDLLSPLAAEDGSFARSYVCLKEHESRCYGRPYMAEIAAFNEWATEEPGFASSVKSKRAGAGSAVVRRAPYKIGKLEVQLLFVPRPKGAGDDDMPKSMNSCIRELKAAEERLSRNWEGHLSQQGGDCPTTNERYRQYWRRRYFKLVGQKLTAYHEATRQPRATINLSNAKRLIDDRRALTQPDTTVRAGKRRRSAFAEEEEGYMFVEEGFRIRFNNGEVIDFYADTAEDKEGWMKVLGDVVGRASGDDEPAPGTANSRKKWCELVLKREEALRKRAEGKRVHSRTKSMIV
ncbi:cell division protein anillin-domain-containing protein [Pseudomassariella vexata]|uniref:Cell division protein anillin-domain-containing protein n=1 Tax=Pseudomassariella vexata TaxID=1141098 RepID=A0A1Y2EEG2_9PEZI|nr:cell division protein anillin-domain-containing protein [Pseudomassariella vexata]ORY69797.1 cell division protein anillin-domain-containing protein [Pseudomassariella vexata]